MAQQQVSASESTSVPRVRRRSLGGQLVPQRHAAWATSEQGQAGGEWSYELRMG